MVFNTIVTETIAISLYHILLALTIITVMSENLAKKLIFSVLGGLCLGIIFITRPEQQQFQIQNVARNTEYKTLLPCSSPSKIKKN